MATKSSKAPAKRENFKGAQKESIDSSINQFKAYEFLCRQREAREWIEEVTGETFAQDDFLDNLKNGILLCKCCNVFSPGSIEKILAPEGVLKFQETDNINKFLDVCTKVGLPKIYLFSIPDLWEKVNVVNVVHCIHSLAHFLEEKGINISKMKNLTDKVQFSEEELKKAEQELKEIEERQRLKSFNALESAFTKPVEKLKVIKNNSTRKPAEYTIPEEPPAWADFLRALGWKVGGSNVTRLFDLDGNELFSLEEVRALEDKVVITSEGENWVDPNKRDITVFPNGEDKGGKNLTVSNKPWEELQQILGDAAGLQLEDFSVVRVFDHEGEEIFSHSDIPEEKGTAIYVTAGEDWINPHWRGVRIKRNNGDKTQKELPIFLPDRSFEDIKEIIGGHIGRESIHEMKKKLRQKIIYDDESSEAVSDEEVETPLEDGQVAFDGHVKRLFDYKGQEIFSKDEIPDKGLVYVSYGEDWVDPESKAVTLYKNGSTRSGVNTKIPPPKTKKIVKFEVEVLEDDEKDNAEQKEVVEEQKTESDKTDEASGEEQKEGAVEGEGEGAVEGQESEQQEQATEQTQVETQEQAPAPKKRKTKMDQVEVALDDENQWEQTLTFVGKHLGVPNAKRLFNALGEEVFNYGQIVEGGIYYATEGEDWIDPDARAVVIIRNGEAEEGISIQVPINKFENMLKTITKTLKCSDEPITRLFDVEGSEITPDNYREKVTADSVIYASSGEGYVDPKWKNVKLVRNGNKNEFADDVFLPKRKLESLKNIIAGKLQMKTKCVKLFNEYGDEITDEDQINDDDTLFAAAEGEEFEDPFAPNVVVLRNGQKEGGLNCSLRRKHWDHVLKTIAHALDMEAVAKIYNETGVEIEDRDEIVDGELLYACVDKDEAWIDPSIEPEPEPEPEIVIPVREFTNTTIFELSDDDLATMSAYDLMKALKAEAEADDEDAILRELQALKTQIVETIRQNNNIEKDVKKMDKKIELLIKNRVTLDEVMASSRGLFSFLRPKPQHRVVHNNSDYKKKMESYSNLFYLLQTDPKYLAKCVYLVPTAKVDQFLETVILSLFGYAFSPREEYLLLSLFKNAVSNEVSNTTTVKGFLEGNPVVAKMVLAYGRRNQGKQYLSQVLGPLIKPILEDSELNLEINPLKIYKEYVNSEEQKTGNRIAPPQDLNEQTAAELPQVKAVLQERVAKLESLSNMILNGLINSIDQLPYGLRWVCKQMKQILSEKFPDATFESVCPVLGYLLYYRFMNPALVSPDAFGLSAENEIIGQNVRRNLVMVSKILQNLTNYSLFLNSVEPAMMVMNDFIQSNFSRIQQFFVEVINVQDPEDHLGVTKYLELTQKNPPQITISLNEIYSTHKILLEYVEDIAKSNDDPLRVILEFLGAAPDHVSDDDNDEISLVLVNKFEKNIGDEVEVSVEATMKNTLDLIRRVLRDLPVEFFGQSLLETLSTARNFIQQMREEGSEKEKVDAMAKNLDEILKNLIILEKERLAKKEDEYRSLLVAIAKDARNRAKVRAQQRREIDRLRTSLDELLKHQNFLKTKTKSYNDYLNSAKQQNVQVKGKGAKQLGPFKFSYAHLKKKGVITQLDIPSITTKAISFVISSHTPGVFQIDATIAGKSLKTLTISLDDLLEKQYNGDTEITIDMVKLNINMTIHTLNKLFVRGK